MKKLWWILAALVVVAALAIAAPFVYKSVRGGDDAPAASVTSEGAEAASGDLDGTWAVVPGEDPNRTAAGYTVDEILRGEPVTVVGSTDQVSGAAEIADSTLESATFEVQVASITTDIGNRDNQFRGERILDTDAHPVATLEVTEPVDLSSVPEDGSTATVPMTIDLTVKGTTVTKPVEVTVLRSGEQLIASGAIDIEWAEVGVTPPDLGFVTVDPAGTIDFLVALEKG